MSPGVQSLPPRQAYALWAGDYDRQPNAVLSLEERVVEPLLPDVRSASVLDVACGTGRWLAKLIARGAAPGIGLDASPEMLREAARRPGLSGRLVRCDGARTPVPDAGIALAICAFGLAYMTRVCPFAGEMARVLEDGGELLLTDLHPGAQERGWRRTFRHGEAVFEAASRIRSLSGICRAFGRAGFELGTRIEVGFGEPERVLFERAGKGQMFRESASQAAVYVLRFRRLRRRET